MILNDNDAQKCVWAPCVLLFIILSMAINMAFCVHAEMATLCALLRDLSGSDSLNVYFCTFATFQNECERMGVAGG